MGIVIRQSLKGTIVNYIGVLLGIFVQFYIVTKYLDPEVIGLTKVLYEVALLCSSFALMGSSSVGMRFFPYFKDADPEKHNNGFFFFYLLLPVVGSILISLIYVACRGPIELFFGKNSAQFNEYFFWVIPLMMVLTFWQFFEHYCNINMRIAVPKAVREVGMRVLMLALYLLYGFHYLNTPQLVAGFILCYGVSMLITGSYMLHIGDHSLRHDWHFITPELRNKILKYEGFVIIAAISGNIMGQLDLFMLSSVRGLYSGGIYAIVLYMAAVVEMPTRSISSIASPVAAQHLKDGQFEEANKLYQQVSLHQLLASLFLLLMVWICLDDIYAIIPNGDKFAEGKYAVLFLGLSKVVYSTLNFGNVLIQFSRYYYWTLFITIFLTILTILTNLFFIPRLGISGAALATLLTALISGTYQQYLVQRKVKGNPFTWAHARTILIIALLLGLNYLIPSLSTISPWLDIFVRCSVLCMVGVFLVYFLRLSQPINRWIEQILSHLKH